MSSKPGRTDPESMLRDWMTIWQSEVAGIGVDREQQENMMRLAGSWARTAAGLGVADDPAGRAGADAAARPTAADDASDAEPAAAGELALLRGEVAGLRYRIEQLEARRRRPARRGPGAGKP